MIWIPLVVLFIAAVLVMAAGCLLVLVLHGQDDGHNLLDEEDE